MAIDLITSKIQLLRRTRSSSSINRCNIIF